jgi:flavin reductase (DIM6/NTAB) family NADH-FMN oxidoreductase RutF
VTRSPYCSGLVPTPVGIVLVNVSGRRDASTVTFFSEVAHHPTSMWVSLNTSSLAHELVQAGGAFTLSVLSRKQRDLAVACGTVSGRDADKCAKLDLTQTPTGFLYLGGAIASTACRVSQTIPLGDHTIFIADLLEGERDTRAARLGPLLSTDI